MLTNRWSLLLMGWFLALPALPASADFLYATTVFRNLISFDSAVPGTIVSSVPITGLTDSFESIVGIDFRPADGRLYALGNAPGSVYRLYTLDLATGVATRVGSTNLNFAGTNWGFDFNPAADRIRLVNDTNLNVRLNPNDGTVAGTDTNINPAGSVVAAAYDRNDTDPGTATTLFGIDSASDQLVRIGGVDGVPSPNGGTVTTIGPLGVDTTGFASFDIASNGTAYAALGIGAPIPSTLYQINLTTGAATLLGQIGDGSDGLTGMSVQIAAVPEPSSIALLGIAGGVMSWRRRRRQSN